MNLLPCSYQDVGHAKCIVVDESRAFITSANFTEAARERNIEAAAVVRDAGFARTVSSQFESLVTGEFVKRVPYL